MAVIVAFFLGVVASAAVVLWYEYSTRPLLRVLLDDTPPAKGHAEGRSPHAFYHLKVRNEAAVWPLPGRKPAWSCKATIELLDQDGNLTLTEPIIGRWISQPEPLIPVIHEGQVLNIIDPARLIAAQKMDIHCHEDQRISIALKFDGRPDCHLFSNESYYYKWQNPAWGLGPGDHHLRVTIYYERGREVASFRLRNKGLGRDDIEILA